MKKLILTVAVLLLPSLALAQLPQPIEGLQNPSVIFGASYLKDDPGAGFQRVQPFVTAGIPLLRLGSIPCAVFGVGLTAGALDPALSEVELGVSLPLLTCAPRGGQFVIQVGYAKIATGVEKPDGYYAGIGFSLTSPATLRAKRIKKAEEKAKKAAELLLTHPTQVAAK